MDHSFAHYLNQKYRLTAVFSFFSVLLHIALYFFFLHDLPPQKYKFFTLQNQTLTVQLATVSKVTKEIKATNIFTTKSLPDFSVAQKQNQLIANQSKDLSNKTVAAHFDTLMANDNVLDNVALNKKSFDSFNEVLTTLQPPKFDVAYLQQIKLNYPNLSRRLGEQGTVILRVYVVPNGSVEQIEIQRSSGFQRLDNAARNLVMQWKFTPAKRGNETISDWIRVPVTFALQ